MVATITQISPTEFRFEYTNAREMPKLMRGHIFTHEGKQYRIIHYSQVFGEHMYSSFLVIARAMDA